MQRFVYSKLAEQCTRALVEMEAFRSSELPDRTFAASPRLLGPIATLAFGGMFAFFGIVVFIREGKYGDPTGYWVMGGFALILIGLGMFWLVRLKRSRLSFKSGKLQYKGVFKNCAVELCDVGVIAAGPGDFFLFEREGRYLFRFPAQFEHIAEALARVAWSRPRGGSPARFLNVALANPLHLPPHLLDAARD